ncbi:MAG: helix-turn-helix transcriptional regulator [Prevotella sp.]|nr:helix-turn-helix transcriptional regulator [Prevotella sp.]
MDIKDRIRQLMVSQQMNQQSFAEELGISAPSLSNIFNSKSNPSLFHVDAIKKRFPAINLDWLLYGQGPMFFDEHSSGDQPEVSSASGQSVTLNAQEQVLDFGRSSSSSPSVVRDQSYGLRGQNVPQNVGNETVKIVDKVPRKITEIRIFYDDQTWETFLPKK